MNRQEFQAAMLRLNAYHNQAINILENKIAEEKRRYIKEYNAICEAYADSISVSGIEWTG